MIASIDSDRDIAIFLEQEEVDSLLTQKINGTLIKLDKPKQQGIISLSIDERKSHEGSSGVKVEEEGYAFKSVGRFKVFIDNDWYLLISENGRFGTRYDTLGSKISIYSREKIDSSMKMHAEHLEFYRDNKDKLLNSLG